MINPTPHPSLKPFNTQVNSLKRLLKDLVHYEREETEQRDKVAKMKEQGQDWHDIRKQEEVLGETLLVVPNTRNMAIRVYQQLVQTMKSMVEDSSVILSTPEWQEALMVRMKGEEVLGVEETI